MQDPEDRLEGLLETCVVALTPIDSSMGPPPKPPPLADYEELLKLCRKGYLDTPRLSLLSSTLFPTQSESA